MNNLRVLLISSFIILSFISYQFIKLNVVKSNKHLLLAHNLPSEHPVHLGMEKFAQDLKTASQGRFSVTIYPNGQLGSEKNVLELVQLGAISMTKVSSLSLESFSPIIGILNLPFLFTDKTHAMKVLDSKIGEELLASPSPQLLRGIAYYDAGDRSFYTSKPILKPTDLHGLKIRVMENATAVKMLKLLGGSPTPMAFGEVYTALQQGVIDGAENNITALTVNRHGEVSKFYSKNEHLFSPDILVISQPVWQSLETNDQKLMNVAATASKIYQRQIWAKMVAEYEKEAVEKMGVTILNPDKKPFIEKVEVLHEEFSARGEDYQRIISQIKSMSHHMPLANVD